MSKWVTFYIGGLIMVSIFAAAVAIGVGIIWLLMTYPDWFILSLIGFGILTFASSIWKRLSSEW